MPKHDPMLWQPRDECPGCANGRLEVSITGRFLECHSCGWCIHYT